MLILSCKTNYRLVMKQRIDNIIKEISLWKLLEIEYYIQVQINISSITLTTKIGISQSSTISFIWKKEEGFWSVVVLSNHHYLDWLKRKLRLNQVARMIGMEWYMNERMWRSIEKRWQCQTIQFVISCWFHDLLLDWLNIEWMERITDK